MVAGLTPEMLKKLSEWSKVPSQANQSKHHPVFNMMKRDGGFFDPRNMIELNRHLLLILHHITNIIWLIFGTHHNLHVMWPKPSARRTIGGSPLDPTRLKLKDRYHGKYIC